MGCSGEYNESVERTFLDESEVEGTLSRNEAISLTSVDSDEKKFIS